MNGAIRRLLDRIASFRLAEGGVAAVEFALILPMMLLLYVGSVEISALISMDRKLQSASGALGDLVARSKASIATDTLEDYFQAAAGIMTPHAAEDLTQVVSMVQVFQDGTTNIVWSRQYQNGAVSVGTKRVAGTSFANMPEAVINVARDNYVVVAEGNYAYPPLYGLAFNQTINLYRENFFMPRFRDVITTP